MEGTRAETIDPLSFARRSPIWRELAAAGARFTAIGDAAVAAAFGEIPEAERNALYRLGLADLSPLPRTGFKGKDTADWLSQQGLQIGDDSNRAYRCGRSSLAVRLAPGDVLILGRRDGGDDLWRMLEQAWTVGAGMVFPVPRRDGTFWFSISGEYAPALFAKLCAVDLRSGRFKNLFVAQTSVARISAIVLRDDLGSVVSYHLLGDSASAGSMWAYLTDAMAEFDGQVVGIDAIAETVNEITA